MKCVDLVGTKNNHSTRIAVVPKIFLHSGRIGELFRVKKAFIVQRAYSDHVGHLNRLKWDSNPIDLGH
jgi:hypothetical protein